MVSYQDNLCYPIVRKFGLFLRSFPASNCRSLALILCQVDSAKLAVSGLTFVILEHQKNIWFFVSKEASMYTNQGCNIFKTTKRNGEENLTTERYRKMQGWFGCLESSRIFLRMLKLTQIRVGCL